MGRVTSFLVLGTALLAPVLYQASIQHYIHELIQSFTPGNQNGSVSVPGLDLTYSTRLLSTDPLLIYISDFLQPKEVTYLLNLGKPLFRRSMITNGAISSQRTSDSCFLPSNNTIVSRIKTRAAHFLGGVPFDSIEAVQLVRYIEDQKVDLHYDWHQGQLPVRRKTGKSYNRLASFFIYIDADCTGGETWFPNATVSSRFQDGDTGIVRTLPSEEGIAVVPKVGSGVFWMNLDGSVGDTRTLHAGLPVRSGTKIGMNIWVMRDVE